MKNKYSVFIVRANYTGTVQRFFIDCFRVRLHGSIGMDPSHLDGTYLPGWPSVEFNRLKMDSKRWNRYIHLEGSI